MTKKPPKPVTVKELGQIKILKASGLTYHAISKEIGRDPKTVKKVCLKPETTKEIQKMKQELSDMFEGLAKRMITSITDEDIQKINAYQRTLSGAVSTDKMRLLREQSTENMNIQALSVDLLEIIKACKENIAQKEIRSALE